MKKDVNLVSQFSDTCCRYAMTHIHLNVIENTLCRGTDKTGNFIPSFRGILVIRKFEFEGLKISKQTDATLSEIITYFKNLISHTPWRIQESLQGVMWPH